MTVSKAFAQFDVDCNGGLDLAELKRAFRAIGFTKLEVTDDIFASFDHDQNGLISIQEFDANLHEKTRAKIEEKLAAGFTFDADCCVMLLALFRSVLPASPKGMLLQVRHKTGSHTQLGNFSSKRGNKNFYKGRGGMKYGIAGPKGGFIHRMPPQWDAPDLSDFPLKPYVMPGEGLLKNGVLETGK